MLTANKLCFYRIKTKPENSLARPPYTQQGVMRLASQMQGFSLTTIDICKKGKRHSNE